MSRNLFWMNYSRSRRKHAHRCPACNRIVKPGERVLMLRLRRSTKVLHEECVDKICVDNHTWGESFKATNEYCDDLIRQDQHRRGCYKDD